MEKHATLARHQQDLEFWKTWKDNGRKHKDLRPLLSNYQGVISSQANKYVGNVELPPAAIEAEFTKQAVKAFDTYDPSKGTQLNTWVQSNMQQGKRWVATYQNTARIGEHRHYKVGRYQNAVRSLENMYDRPPTNEELSEELGWSPKEVSKVGSDIRKSNIESAYEGDPTTILPSRTTEVIKLVKYDLTPQEKLVYEYTLGEGKPQLNSSQIAKKLNISNSKVGNIKKKIYSKMEGNF